MQSKINIIIPKHKSTFQIIAKLCKYLILDSNARLN